MNKLHNTLKLGSKFFMTISKAILELFSFIFHIISFITIMIFIIIFLSYFVDKGSALRILIGNMMNMDYQIASCIVMLGSMVLAIIFGIIGNSISKYLNEHK